MAIDKIAYRKLLQAGVNPRAALAQLQRDAAEDVAVAGLQPAGAAATDAEVAALFSALPAAYLSFAGLSQFPVTKYGAVVDGVTDDTAAVQAAIDAAASAGGGVVTFPAGVCLIAGALQDGSGANAQLVLPSRDYVDDEQLTIVLRGVTPPPPIFSVIGATPLPDAHSVIKSTRNTGAGGAVIGGWGPAATFGNFTNVMVRLENLTVRLPSNPVLTAINLSRVGAADLENVTCDVGIYQVQGLTQPTTSTSYGIKLPGNDNGAYTRLRGTNVVGFYTGYQFAEHTTGDQVTAMGCLRAAEFLATNHASHIGRMLVQHCSQGLIWSGIHYVNVTQYDTEHASTGWWVNTVDISDASNFGKGRIRYHTVKQSVGISSEFVITGAAGLDVRRMTEDVEARRVLWASDMDITEGTPVRGNVSSVPVWLLPDGANSAVRGAIQVPLHWIGKTVSVNALLVNPGASAGNVELRNTRQEIDAGVNVGSGFVTLSLTATVGAQNVVQRVTFSASITLAGSYITMSFQRQGGHANDTLAADMGLVGFEFIRV